MAHNHTHEHCDCHEEHEHHEHHGHHHDEGHEHHHEGHEHHRHEEHGVKEAAIKIGVAAALLVGAVILEKNTELPKWALLLVYLVPYLVVGWETLKEAAEGLLHGEALSEDFLMSVATLGALGIGFMPGAQTQFPEAVFVMLFFQLGEMFEGIAEGRSRKSIAHLMDIRPDVAHMECEIHSALAGPRYDSEEAGLRNDNGEAGLVDKHPSEIHVGSIIVIRPGEKVPLDGIVLEGTSSLDTVALTGESVPRNISAGDEILSGCVNLSGVLRVRTTKAFGESTASKILELVESATERKSRSESFITKFARIYTPIVVALAALVAIIPSLITGEWATWVYRGLMFLVVSCPCALVISVPLSFFGGIGGASRKGILIKGANLMDTLRSVRTVVFDKTGTLTEGVFEVTAVHPDVIDQQELLHLAAHVERHSTHPIAMALRNAYPNEADECEIANVEEIAGHGVAASVNGKRVAVGNSKLMEAEGAAWRPCHHEGTIVHVSIDGEYAGHIVISDKVKADAASAISALKEAGVRRTVMLTGDQKAVAASVASAIGIDEYRAELLPADKVEALEALMGERFLDCARNDNGAAARNDNGAAARNDNGAAARNDNGAAARNNGAVAFVGDGINDAPVLARADVGIAMGALGSDAAIEAADVVLMDDKPSALATAIRIARRTVRIATENIWFAVGVKVAVLALAAIGLATMWMAVFADVGVTVLAVLNAMRALK